MLTPSCSDSFNLEPSQGSLHQSYWRRGNRVRLEYRPSRLRFGKAGLCWRTLWPSFPRKSQPPQRTDSTWIQLLGKLNQEADNQVTGLQLRAPGRKHTRVSETQASSQRPAKWEPGEPAGVGRRLGVQGFPPTYKHIFLQENFPKQKLLPFGSLCQC